MKKIKILSVLLLTFCLSVTGFSQIPLKFNLTAGANLPMGEFKDVYSAGVSVEAAGFYSIPVTGIDLSLSIGYNSFSFKNEYFTNLVKNKLLVGVKDFNPSWSASDIPIMVGARYNIPAVGFSPYVWGEVGVHMLSFKDRFKSGKMTASSSDPTNVSWQTNIESGSETAFGYAIGAGVLIPLVPKLKLDVNFKFNGNRAVYSKSFEVFRNSNSNFTNPELKGISFLTMRAGILIDL